MRVMRIARGEITYVGPADIVCLLDTIFVIFSFNLHQLIPILDLYITVTTVQNCGCWMY